GDALMAAAGWWALWHSGQVDLADDIGARAVRREVRAVGEQGGGVEVARGAQGAGRGPGPRPRVEDLAVAQGDGRTSGELVATDRQHLAVAQQDGRMVLPGLAQGAGIGPGSKRRIIDLGAGRAVSV